MIVKEFEGSSKEDAIQNALNDLKLPRESLNIEVIKPLKKRSFFDFSKQVVKIKVFFDEYKKTNQDSELVLYIKKYLYNIFDNFDIKTKIKLLKENDSLVVIEIRKLSNSFENSEQYDILTNIKVLNSIQSILNITVINYSRKSNSKIKFKNIILKSTKIKFKNKVFNKNIKKKNNTEELYNV